MQKRIISKVGKRHLKKPVVATMFDEGFKEFNLESDMQSETHFENDIENDIEKEYLKKKPERQHDADTEQNSRGSNYRLRGKNYE